MVHILIIRLGVEQMHVSDATMTELRKLGWAVNAHIATKHFANVAEAGTISNGSRVLTVDGDAASGRWFSIMDGWNVVKDFDTRDYVESPKTLATLIDAFCINYKA
jgi:hypothetical protein